MKRMLLFSFLAMAGLVQAFSQGMEGSWQGTLQAGPQALTLVLHVECQQEPMVTLDVLEQGASGLPMTVDTLTADTLSVSIPQLALSIAGKRNGDEIKATFRQSMFSAPMTFKRFSRPQEPKKPYPYATEDLTFGNAKDHVVLSGTLTWPVDYKPGQQVPVVLMVTGSGPQNRDEELFGHKPFLVIADWLARHGIASLRYDDRGVGKSTAGDVASPTTLNLADDASAGVDFLRKLHKFSKVGVLGHSEGGMIAYMLGGEGKADFIVSLAGPACKVDTMLMAQLNGLAQAQGAQQPLCHSVAEARSYLLSRDSSAWMRTFLDMDVRPYVKKVTCPVLALSGGSDLNVPANLNNAALRQVLPHNNKNKVKVYPGLNHCFQHEATGNPLSIGKTAETISPEVLKDISGWINGL